jgi:hypothetical protein
LAEPLAYQAEPGTLEPCFKIVDELSPADSRCLRPDIVFLIYFIPRVEQVARLLDVEELNKVQDVFIGLHLHTL